MLSEDNKSINLFKTIKDLLENESTGILYLKTKVDSWQHQKSYILIFNCGLLTFGDLRIPTIRQFDRILREISKSDLFDSALVVAKTRINNPNSVRELVEILIKLQVLTWKEVEVWVAKKIICNLELFLHYPSETKWQEDNSFDLLYGEDLHGLNWSKIEDKLNKRQKQWLSLTSIIPHLEIIPIVTPKQLEQIEDLQIKKHLKDVADGNKTLLNIADIMQKDPLKIAKTYFNWFKNGWICFEKNADSQLTVNLPLILSLDDSPIVQTKIKRALQAEYKVLLASNAQEALEILKKYPIQLLLLDLTLPDIDGLEFCQKVRKLRELKDLPIIMLTGRDGLVDRAKGRFAGTNKYLTKPFKPEELSEIVAHYVN